VPASELIELVADVIDRHRSSASAQNQAQLDALQRRLREPVRIAIVGRVKAGKSTMVNALLGQRVAPTDVSECTRLVTWFHYGHPQRLVMEMRDGTTVDRQLAQGSVLPTELGVPAREVASLHAYLANDALKNMTLIDTPGLGSVHPGYSASTEQLLEASRSSIAAADRADAVVFLMNQVVLEDEMSVLGSLSEQSADGSRTVGVLGRADQLGDGSGDSWQVAVELAEHFSDLFEDRLRAVVPVIGLLAETAETATLTERDVASLRQLAQLPPAEYARLTWSADRFLSTETDVPVAERRRLLEALALYGVTRCVELVRDSAVGASTLRRELTSRSGIGDVRRSLAQLFGDREHVLKVRSVLAALNRMSYHWSDDSAANRALRDDLDALRTAPQMQPVAEIEAWQAVSSGKVTLPENLRGDLRNLLSPGSARTRLGAAESGDLRALAKDAIVRWRVFLNTEATPPQQAVARVALRSYQLIWSSV
jgi:GTPase SAR1 family protein